MKREKKLLLIGILLIILGMIFFFLRINEDSWIKNENGIWIKHGNPTETPDEVLKQQEVISCAYDLFKNFSGEISSQCLGKCGDYSVNIVHSPRTDEDDKIKNQCEKYIQGKTNSFIELDQEGNIIGII